MPIYLREQSIDIYVFFQICLHHGPAIDPDNRDGVDNQWVLDTIKMIIHTYFPTLEKEPRIVETCIYTVKCFCLPQISVYTTCGKEG
jgi:hypothetical protein